MSKAKLFVSSLILLACTTVHAFTLAEVGQMQGELARAKLSADIEKAKADARNMGAPTAIPEVPIAASSAEPARDAAAEFTAYGYYRFGLKACVDVVYQGHLYSRCLGASEPIVGWKLQSLTPERAVFSKGKQTRELPLGVVVDAKAPVSSALPPIPPALDATSATIR